LVVVVGGGRVPGMALPVVAAVVVVIATCHGAVVVVMGKGMICIPIQFLDPGRTPGYI